MRYKVAPARFVQVSPAKPKRSRGCPRKSVDVQPPQPKRPHGRPPKYLLAEVLAAARATGPFTN
ncbi:MAG: hypothetical protein H0V70_21060 [Ktedonobacteraceae bacterium]|nr:hypothetical protein [Ktedonobacteraceae bacterium]